MSTRKRIRIQGTQKGAEVGYVVATVIGDWAIHRTWRDEGQCEDGPRQWTLTHRPTGCAAAQWITYRSALRLLKALRALRQDWAGIKNRSAAVEALGDKLPLAYAAIKEALR